MKTHLHKPYQTNRLSQLIKDIELGLDEPVSSQISSRQRATEGGRGLLRKIINHRNTKQINPKLHYSSHGKNRGRISIRKFLQGCSETSRTYSIEKDIRSGVTWHSFDTRNEKYSYNDSETRNSCYSSGRECTSLMPLSQTMQNHSVTHRSRILRYKKASRLENFELPEIKKMNGNDYKYPCGVVERFEDFNDYFDGEDHEEIPLVRLSIENRIQDNKKRDTEWRRRIWKVGVEVNKELKKKITDDMLNRQRRASITIPTLSNKRRRTIIPSLHIMIPSREGTPVYPNEPLLPPIPSDRPVTPIFVDKRLESPRGKRGTQIKKAPRKRKAGNRLNMRLHEVNLSSSKSLLQELNNPLNTPILKQKNALFGDSLILPSNLIKNKNSPSPLSFKRRKRRRGLIALDYKPRKGDPASLKPSSHRFNALKEAIYNSYWLECCTEILAFNGLLQDHNSTFGYYLLISDKIKAKDTQIREIIYNIDDFDTWGIFFRIFNCCLHDTEREDSFFHVHATEKIGNLEKYNLAPAISPKKRDLPKYNFVGFMS